MDPYDSPLRSLRVVPKIHSSTPCQEPVSFCKLNLLEAKKPQSFQWGLGQLRPV